MENNCIIKGMETKFVGWLSPKTIQNKKASSLNVEFTKPEHAIDEGLIIDAAMQQCEYYDRGCKLKQYFNCQQYGHIDSQGTAAQGRSIAQKRTTQSSARGGQSTHTQNPNARCVMENTQLEQRMQEEGKAMDWLPQSSASKDTPNATQEGQENTIPSATQSDTIIVYDEKTNVIDTAVQRTKIGDRDGPTAQRSGSP
jgi:hypothetical protein